MKKEISNICYFCGKKVNPEKEKVSLLLCPDNILHYCHDKHYGVKEYSEKSTLK